MAKILNLDALSQGEAREVVIGGVAYEVPDMTVENFVETTRVAQKLAADESATVADQVEAAVDMVARCIPTAEVAVLRNLSLQQLNAITAFIRGEDVEKAQEAAQEQAAVEGEDASGN
ncbi:hypothetical protein [Paraburkholderia sp.]|uniref:hypothetical protein n=1 Tax=Paraburkholderia sp. TaxID=1926495 RepID=UPI0039E31892